MKQGVEFAEFLNQLGIRPYAEAQGVLGRHEDEDPKLFSMPELIAGPSVYDLAVEQGFTGTKAQFLATLKGLSAYEIAVAEGYSGNRPSWLASLKGMSAYQQAVANGFVGTVTQYLESLKGKSVYQQALDEGFVGSFEDFVETLQGDKGDAGDRGPRGFSAGVPLTFSSNNANTTPGDGKYKFNNAVLANITFINISHTDMNGSSITSWINSIGNVPNTAGRGVLRFQNIDTIGGFAEFRVVGDRAIQSDYTRIPVTYLSGSLPADGANIGVTFNPSGVYAIPNGGVQAVHIDAEDKAGIRLVLQVDSTAEVTSKIAAAIAGTEYVAAAQIKNSDVAAIRTKLQVDSSTQVNTKVSALRTELLNIDEQSITANGNITAAMNRNTLVCEPSSNIVLALASSPSLGDNWYAIVSNITNNYTVTLNGIFENGATSIILYAKQSVLLQCNGTIVRWLLRGGPPDPESIIANHLKASDAGNIRNKLSVPSKLEANNYSLAMAIALG